LDRNRPKSAQLEQETETRPRVRARVGKFAQKTLSFCTTRKSPRHYLMQSLTHYRNLPEFYFFAGRGPRRRTARGRTPVSLRQPVYAKTGSQLWFKSNYHPNQCFPLTNLTNGALTCSVHGDSGQDRWSNAFPVISDFPA
jgi:hypothetical protein